MSVDGTSDQNYEKLSGDFFLMTSDPDLDSKPMIRIVCAAIRCVPIGEAPTVLAGVRHRFIKASHTLPRLHEEGFLTNQNQFVTRTEAWRIAEAAGQIINKPLNPGSLSSEDIY